MADVGEIRARLTLTSDDFNRGMQQARSQMDQTARSAATTKESFDKIQKASAMFAGVVGGIFAASIGTAATFEQKMKDVQAISGESADNMQKLSDLAIDMGNKTAFSASEAADGIQELVKAGISVTDILNGGLEGALNLAVAGNLSLADAAQVASTALNAFHKDGLSVAQAADILAGAANASATDVSEMQQGLSQVSAVAAGAGLSFRDTATSLAVMAQFGLRGSDAGTSLKTMLLNLTPSTKQASEEMIKLGLETKNGSIAFYDAQGHIKSMSDIAQILHEKLGKLTDQQRQQALQTLFGTDSMRAANILYEQGAQGINDMWSAMSKVTAADVAKTKMETLKGAFDNLKSSFETAGIEVGQQFLPMLTQITRQATDVIGSLDNVKLANIEGALTFAGTASSVAFLGTKFAGLIKTAATLLPALGPTGWIILGVAALAGVVAGAVVQHKLLDDAMVNNIKTGIDQANSLNDTINKYQDLQMQAHLTTDEFGHYLDLQAQLKSTSDPTAIAKIKDEMDKLREKSGLSNEQLNDMIKYNQTIVDKTPEVKKAISEQGQSYVDNTKAVKDYNDAKLKSLFDELDLKRIANETKSRDLLKEQTDLIGKKKSQMQDLGVDQEKANAAVAKERDEQETLNGMLNDQKNYTADQIQQQKDKVQKAQLEASTWQQILEHQATSIQNTDTQIAKNGDERKKLEDVNFQMAQILLQQSGLTAQKGQEVKTIDDAIGKLQQQKTELQNTTPAAQRNTQEYRDAVTAIDNQIGKLQTAKQKVIDLTGEASALNDELSKDITKKITEIHYQQSVALVSQGNRVAGGPQSSYHTGGIVGLPQLHVGGLASQFASAPNHNEIDVRLLRNEAVLTESQQANLMRMIDAGFTGNQNNAKQGTSKVYNVNVDAKNVDVDEQQLTRYLQRLEALYG